MAAPDVALTLLACIPSGTPGVVLAREGISGLAIGPGWHQQATSSSPPILTSCSSCMPLPPDCVYIGSNSNEMRTTRWSNPFDPRLYSGKGELAPLSHPQHSPGKAVLCPAAVEPFEAGCCPLEPGFACSAPAEPGKAGCESCVVMGMPGKVCPSRQIYRRWLERRADLAQLLAPLCGKKLVCDCGMEASCHGSVLIELYLDVFSSEVQNYIDPPTYSPTHTMPSPHQPCTDLPADAPTHAPLSPPQPCRDDSYSDPQTDSDHTQPHLSSNDLSQDIFRHRSPGKYPAHQSGVILRTP